MTRILDALAFASLWVAAAAMCLAAASSRSFGASRACPFQTSEEVQPGRFHPQPSGGALTTE